MPDPMTGYFEGLPRAERVEVITSVQRRRRCRRHEGRIAVDARNTRWCSDGLEIGCDNGERVRVAFALDLLRPGGHELRGNHQPPSILRAAFSTEGTARAGGSDDTLGAPGAAAPLRAGRNTNGLRF
jgi:hypothetical protein